MAIAGYRYENGKSRLTRTVTDNTSLTPDDNGAVLRVNSATGKNVTVPSLLPTGFHCRVIQVGAGQVTFVESSTSIENVSGHTKTSGQWAEVSIRGLGDDAPDVFILSGSTAA